jgi:hypothetical protein
MVGDAIVKKFIINRFKLISRLDRDIGVIIDNCLGFLYSVDLGHDMRRETGRIESALYDMVYLGRTPAGCEFKENLFRTRILPLMKALAPPGYYFGIDPENTSLLGYWLKPAADADYESHDPLSGNDDNQSVPTGTPAAG